MRTVVMAKPRVNSVASAGSLRRVRRERISSRPARRLRERGRNCFDAPHSFAIVDLFAAIRALVEREAGDRISSSLRCSAPVTPHAPDSPAATSWTYFQVHRNSLRSLGRDEEIVGLSSVLRHQLAFRIDRHAIQILTLDDVEILTDGPPQGTTGTELLLNVRRIENRLGYIQRRQPVPFHFKPGFFAEGVAPSQDSTLDSNQDIAHGSPYSTSVQSRGEDRQGKSGARKSGGRGSRRLGTRGER